MLKNYNYAHCKSTKGKKPQSNHHGDATRLFWLVVKTKIMRLRKHTHTHKHTWYWKFNAHLWKEMRRTVCTHTQMILKTLHYRKQRFSWLKVKVRLIYPKKGQNMKIFQKLKNSALHTTNSYKKLAESYVKKNKKKYSVRNKPAAC
jgi:hypothetical protein